MQTSCRVALLVFVVVYSAFAQVSRPVKWACVGNSITAGEYPSKLATRLGPSYFVQNDGVSSKTMLKTGVDGTTDAPGKQSYWTTPRLDTVFTFKPDIITIALGTNDSKPLNWADSAHFVRDYTAMVDTLATIPSKPQIWLILPSPAWSNGADPTSIRGLIIKNSVIPRILQIAASRNLNTIDLNTPLANHPELFPDQVHPNSAGADSIAAIIFRAYAAKCVRIACIGNSITQYGASSTIPDIDAYPSKLGMLLGRGYLVQNDGVSGCAMQKQNAGWSYWKEGAFKFPLIFDFKPNVVTIKLGTNDSRRYYWHTAPFITDCKAMADTLNNTISPKPVIKLCFPIPATPAGFQKYGINDTIINDSVIPAIKQVAAAKGLSTIDLNTPMRPLVSLLIPSSDGVHPSAAGQDTLAHFMYRNFTVASMQLSSSSLVFSTVTGQRDTAGTQKVDTVRNTAIAGTLAAVAVLHQSAWLSCSVDNTAPNVQKIATALKLGSLPATPGVYTDTVTVTAANANPASVTFTVTLTLRQGTGVADRKAGQEISPAVRVIERSGGICVRMTGPGRHTVTLTDARGKVISSKEIDGSGLILFSKPGQSGLHIIGIKSEGYTVNKKVISYE